LEKNSVPSYFFSFSSARRVRPSCLYPLFFPTILFFRTPPPRISAHEVLFFPFHPPSSSQIVFFHNYTVSGRAFSALGLRALFSLTKQYPRCSFLAALDAFFGPPPLIFLRFASPSHRAPWFFPPPFLPWESSSCTTAFFHPFFLAANLLLPSPLPPRLLCARHLPPPSFSGASFLTNALPLIKDFASAVSFSLTFPTPLQERSLSPPQPTSSLSFQGNEILPPGYCPRPFFHHQDHDDRPNCSPPTFSTHKVPRTQFFIILQQQVRRSAPVVTIFSLIPLSPRPGITPAPKNRPFQPVPQPRRNLPLFTLREK